MKWLKDRFYYATQGVWYAFKNDKSIRLQGYLGCIALLAGFIFRVSMQEWIWILLCIILVLFSEFMNSCIEQIVDYISLERNDRARHIKDMAAGATMLVCLFAFIVACCIFIPKVWEVIHGL